MLEGQLRTRRKEKAVGDHKLYYAYGSNMDMTQMETRCPDAGVYWFGNTSSVSVSD